MLASVTGCAVVGLSGEPVSVEVDIASGLPALNIVGLPDAAVSEAKERVRAALRNAGASLPARRITVNLAPADLRKEGTGYDLPIAVGILIASGQIPPQIAHGAVFLGELALNGDLRHVPGVLPVAASLRTTDFTRLILPDIDAPEAALIDTVDVIGFPTLTALIAAASGDAPLPRVAPTDPADAQGLTTAAIDFSDVRGQEHVKRALEVAAAGGHNILMAGPPGAGKTLLARAVPGILPPLARDEALSVTAVYSVGGMLPEGVSLVRARPFRSPITRSPTPASSAADASPAPARSASPTTASSSWTNSPSSTSPPWRPSANPSKTASSPSPAPRAPSPTPPTSCSSPP